MKTIIAALFLINASLSFALEFENPDFMICERPGSYCLKETVKAEAIEVNSKTIPSCDEVTAITQDGSRKVVFYDCKIMVNTKNEVSAMRLRVKPFGHFPNKAKGAVKPKFDPSKPFTVIEP